MRPFTNVIPKELLPIGNIPAIDLIVKELVEAGIEEINIVLNSQTGEILKRHLFTSEHSDKFVYHLQEAGYGNAMPLKSVKINEDFIYAFGDDLSYNNATKQLMSEPAGCVVATERIPKAEVGSYGTIKPYKGSIEVQEVCEKLPPDKAPSNLAIYGRFLLTPSIYKALKATKVGKDNELWMADVLNNSEEMVLAPPIDGCWQTIGNVKSYIEAINKYYENIS
jgi:UTP--glucose-1-phosphate uridylyltransferase